MSRIHVNHIKTKLTEVFEGIIDLSDAPSSGDQRDNFFLTRAQCAYAIMHHSNASAPQAAQSIVDGGDDNGVDGIFYDPNSKTLYIAQSKWIHNGTGEPSNGDVKKFIAGIKDLFDFKFERFNRKIRTKQQIIEAAICDHKTRYQIILTYTGINDLAEPSKRDFEDLLGEFNDASEIVYLSVFNQARIHSSIVSSSAENEPIDLTVQLNSFGKIQDPVNAFYGQVNGVEIYGWWDTYRDRLFAKNIRGVLGDSNVNLEIAETLKENPSEFWFLNNGITMICDTVEKNMVGGATTEVGQFACTNLSVVNGAQTVSTIGRFGEQDPSALASVFVPVRIISLSETVEGFGQKITKANNTQNKVEARDFVTFDPEQTRLRDELLMDDVDYHFSRGQYTNDDKESFGLIQATTSLACASNNTAIVVQLKREIGKLWDDLEKAPYKSLFNPTITGRFVRNCVKTQEIIDASIKDKIDSMDKGRDQSIVIHGNRIIAQLIFKDLNKSKYGNSIFNFDSPELKTKMDGFVDSYFDKIKTIIDRDYDNAMIPTLFKNLSKCEGIVEEIVTNRVARPEPNSSG
ncbi:AIPR family protein [Cyclobacterium sp. 1_MG-2023]|uniref:AIPR family protein n=1 Tax=Cyclobacterium sp. 1_MG-2023 TaxID=3062681 RepID=UPI0026E29E89|nr:AIPR family protein [Cyclobacterium sp. 1_MG-2023]MDO6438556.1 AIPR family protein [Cyclobacterium sp. 1_MG-2023]